LHERALSGVARFYWRPGRSPLILRGAPPQTIVLNLWDENVHRSANMPLLRYERINVLQNLSDDPAYQRRFGARMSDRAEPVGAPHA